MTILQEALTRALSNLSTVAPILVLGALLAWLLWWATGRAARRALPAEVAALLQRAVAALVVGLAVANALQQLGVDLSVLLGAASVLTVAVGFAAQTSTSNFISGLFLIAERPFTVGDIIEAAGFTGEVMAIDLLSVKLRSFDNRYIRLPNETVMKAEIINLTRYPIRRSDLSVALDMAADAEAACEVLLGAARALPVVLDEPMPAIVFEQFEETGMRLKLTAWASRESYFVAKRDLALQVHRLLRESGVGLFVRGVRLSPSAPVSLSAPPVAPLPAAPGAEPPRS